MRNIEHKICYIVAACTEDVDNINFTPSTDDLVIAADGGFDTLNRKNIRSDVLLGDFDSIKNLPQHKNVVKYPTEKDDTDTFLAYKLGVEKGYNQFIVFGGIGGRLDHTLGNIQTILHISENGNSGFLIGNKTVVTAISNSSIRIPGTLQGTISVFAQGRDAIGVTLKGLKYEADNIIFPANSTLGVSNEFIGKNAEISVKEGTLLIVWQQSTEDFLKEINNFIK